MIVVLIHALIICVIIINVYSFLHNLKPSINRVQYRNKATNFVSLLDKNEVNYQETRGRTVSDVVIESPSLNSRRISASIVIDSDIDDVWKILTDYNNLSDHVPNLVKSYVVPSPVSTTNTAVRLFQEGAQKIVGFDFRASLTMDMTEDWGDENRSMQKRVLRFKLVDSSMFATFDGTWTVKYHSRNKKFDPISGQMTVQYRSELTYSVYIKPKGLVPVIALEWRIREDVPPNLIGLKTASERYALAKQIFLIDTNNNNDNSNNNNNNNNNNQLSGTTTGGGGYSGSSQLAALSQSRVVYSWGQDETLDMYMQNSQKKISAIDTTATTATATVATTTTPPPAASSTSTSSSSSNNNGNSNSNGSAPAPRSFITRILDNILNLQQQ